MNLDLDFRKAIFVYNFGALCLKVVSTCWKHIFVETCILVAAVVEV